MTDAINNQPEPCFRYKPLAEAVKQAKLPLWHITGLNCETCVLWFSGEVEELIGLCVPFVLRFLIV